MSDLQPIALDIETTGLDETAEVTVVGVAHDLGESLWLNTDGREADRKRLVMALDEHSSGCVQLEVTEDERALLNGVAELLTHQVNGDRHYLTAYHGETWNGGFDLPFLRTRYIRNGMDWPIGEVPYSDVFEVVDRFYTGEESDLEGVYTALVGAETCDPFEDSVEALTAYESGNWLPLLEHNLADIKRTRELAQLANRFVPKSDFGMKNLAPPGD